MSCRSVLISTFGACALALVSTTPADAQAPPPVAAQTTAKKPPVNEIRFIVTVDNNKGQVACALFRRSGWLEKAEQAGFTPIQKKTATCVFRNVTPGVYAITTFHDENGNKRLDKNFIGLPTEDWCTSYDAPAVFGPPTFDAAKFRYKGGTVELREKM
jgi:uncharacterized protein (DUF2141 family)